MGLITAWGLVTIALVFLLLYRSRLESKEADWIPLTDDAREERAIHAQTIVEMRAGKLRWPIRALGALSIVLLLVMIGYWFYLGITTSPGQ
ncbi:MAG: hypothetical protein LAN62_19135 [Acidobacteriia bacterium]|nr:hypothetical protein [Terriglobia bacterium]